jgi:hypothetical protein
MHVRKRIVTHYDDSSLPTSVRAPHAPTIYRLYLQRESTVAVIDFDSIELSPDINIEFDKHCQYTTIHIYIKIYETLQYNKTHVHQQ